MWYVQKVRLQPRCREGSALHLQDLFAELARRGDEWTCGRRGIIGTAAKLYDVHVTATLELTI